MLYILPIEPLNERYSAQWLHWTKEYLKDMSDWSIICPEMHGYSRVEKGAFLDVVNTNVFKNKQMEVVLSLFQNDKIKDGDIFWFHDLWFPGIEQLAYIRDGLKMDFKIYGYLHAGTYDDHDFLTKQGMRPWGEHFESAIFRIVDGIFVATDFHKQMIRKKISKNYFANERKIHVVPFPIYPDFVDQDKLVPHNLRAPIVVFPHRLDEEKNPQMFDKFSSYVSMYSKKEFTFVKTKEVSNGNKGAYYDWLKKAKYAVSFADQETWGIAMQEAVMCGCIPIVPDRLSYREMYFPIFKYDSNPLNSDVDNALQKLFAFENMRSECLQSCLDNQREKFIRKGEIAFKCLEPWLFPSSYKPILSPLCEEIEDEPY